MTVDLMQSDLFNFFLLPLLIFVARICDVTLGTLRIIFISKGKKYLAPILGFFEVLIWITTISRIMHNLDNWICYIAYAGGFAAGNYIGLLVEERIAMGVQMIRIVTQRDATSLIDSLNKQGYGATSIEAKGSKERVHVIYTVVKRENIRDVVGVIQEFNPKAFYSIEDIRFVNEGVFPIYKTSMKNRLQWFRWWRKGI
jgi:uncharacterized protein YebE (UPF0316 family)